MPNDSLPLLGKSDKARLAFRIWRLARIEQKVATRQSCNHTDKRWGPTPRYWSRAEDAEERRGSKNLSPRLCVTQRPLRAKNRLLRDLCGLLFNFLFSARPYACSMERMTCRIAADERVAVQSGSQKFSEDTSSMAGAFDSALYRANDLRR